MRAPSSILISATSERLRVIVPDKKENQAFALFLLFKIRTDKGRQTRTDTHKHQIHNRSDETHPTPCQHRPHTMTHASTHGGITAARKFERNTALQLSDEAHACSSKVATTKTGIAGGSRLGSSFLFKKWSAGGKHTPLSTTQEGYFLLNLRSSHVALSVSSATAVTLGK